MDNVRIFSKEEVIEMYPIGSSYSAKLAREAIRRGLKVASIKDDDLNNDWENVIQICAATIEGKSCFNRMTGIIDMTRLENKEVIIAFDDTCNH